MATLNLSMPDEMRAFIEARVSAGEYQERQVTIFVISSDMTAKKQRGSWLKDWKAELHDH